MHRSRANFLVSTLLVIGGIIWRWLASRVAHAGHADYAFYYQAAHNLAAGRGLVVDYVWHFFSGTPPIPHRADDYWQPLTPTVIAGFLRVFGDSVRVAIVPSMLGVGLVLLGTYVFAREALADRTAALTAVLFALASAVLWTASVVPDTAAYLGAFVATFLAAAVRSRKDERFAVVAAAAAGLAYLARQDGILLAPALVLAVRQTTRHRALALALYAGIVVPRLLSAEGGRAVLLTSYEDLYSLTPPTLRAWASAGIAAHARSRLEAIAAEADALWAAAGPLWGLALFYGVVILRRKRRSALVVWGPGAAYGAVLLMFYAAVAPLLAQQGSILRCMPALVPLIATAAAGGLSLARVMPLQRHRLVVSRDNRLVVGFALALAMMIRSVGEASALVSANNAVGAEMAAVGATLRSIGADSSSLAIMTRVPWQLNLETGARAIQIPNGDPREIASVASRYSAQFVLLPAPRPALDEMHLVEVARVPGTKYRIASFASQVRPTEDPPSRRVLGGATK